MYIISETSRGIGLELTRTAASLGHHVLAVARNPEDSAELRDLQNKFEKLELLKLDLLEADAHNIIFKKISHWPQVDVLLNNAGIYEKDDNLENFEKSFLTNSIKPFFITRALLSKLKKSPRPVSLQISSLMGSLSDNTSGGSYSYRASKFALNMLYKSLSVDEKWLISLLIHPGWVQTSLGGDSAPVSVIDSVKGIWNLIQTCDLKQTGTFKNYKGDALSW